MVKKSLNNGKCLWFSDDNDWYDKQENLICVWEHININPEEYSNFIEFVKKEVGADVEIIGQFKEHNIFNNLVFTVKNNISKFSVWRFNNPGMRFWFDVFSQINGGLEIEDYELNPIIEKLGLTVQGMENTSLIKNEEVEELCGI